MNRPQNGILNRRQMLSASLPVLAGSIATGALVGEVLDAEPADPHQEWFERWLVVRDEINTSPDIQDSGKDPLWQELSDLELSLIETPVTTVGGLLATLKFAVEEGYDLGQMAGFDRRFTECLIANIGALEGEMV